MTGESHSEQFLISIIDLGIDITSIVKDCLEVVAKYKELSAETHDLSKPYSIVLTKNPDVQETAGKLVNYSTVHNTKYFDRPSAAHLLEEHESTGLQALVDILPFPFSIMRLSILPANTIIGMHTDASCHAQLAISTNQDSFVSSRTGESMHIPVDGKLYIISTTLPHTAYNASDHERIHLSISIYDEDYVKLLQERT